MKDKLVCNFKLVAAMVGDGVREFVYNVDGSAFLKRELVASGMNRYRLVVRVHDCKLL